MRRLVILSNIILCMVTLSPVPHEIEKGFEAVLTVNAEQNWGEIYPDAGLNVFEIIEKYDYPFQRHTDIQTEDGYLLEVHRIPYGLKSGPAENKPVIFLMHGILCSSVDWVNTGPRKGLAFLLADMGYDVWMGNARGNTWSRKHVKYNPDENKEKFWNFSWNEIGIKDLPAMIDYVLAQTNQGQLYYIGHSQGTTSFFVMCAERPEYNDKILLMIALSPVVYMKNVVNPFFKFLALFDGALKFPVSFIGMYEFIPDTEFLSRVGNIFCKDGALFQEMCAAVIFLIGGFDSQQLNRSMIPVILTNTPAGASTKQFAHYAQEINSGKFGKYDYGFVQNLVEYGTMRPPDYSISNITAPVALFYSKNDWLAAVEDVNKFAKELPNIIYQYLIPFDKFNHLDFMWANDVVTLLYNAVFKVLQYY